MANSDVNQLLPSDHSVSCNLDKYFYLNGESDVEERTRIQLNGEHLLLTPEVEQDQCGAFRPVSEYQISLYDVVGINFDHQSCHIHPNMAPSYGYSFFPSSMMTEKQLSKDVCDKSFHYCRHLTTSLSKKEANPTNKCQAMMESPNSGSNDNVDQNSIAHLTIIAYLLKDKNESNSEDDGHHQRKRFVLTLSFSSFPVYEHNLQEAQEWSNAIKHNRRLLIQKRAEHLPAAATSLSSPQRSLLILLNPKSGSGRGKHIFQKQVEPILNDARMLYELIITTHPNCARDLVRNCPDLLQYAGIVIASGDGLFFEVVNGIMERDDWQQITRVLPMGIIPCGSGNGLAKSIAHHYGESFIEPSERMLNATLTCVSERSAPLDVVKVELYEDLKSKVVMQLYSILSVGWGFIADVDIGSEHLRFMGSQRFTLWSVYRLINLKVYRGRVSYLPYSKSTENSSTSTLKYREKSDINGINQQNSCLANSILKSSISEEESIEQDEMAGEQHSIPPHLDQSIPDNWCSVEGDFIMVHAAYTTHLASDCHFIPEARLNDGIIHLVLVRAGIPRLQLARFLLNMSNGTHFQEGPSNSPHIQVIRVYAFRIEPQNNYDGGDGILTVDGERVPYGPIQASILPGLIRVMVPARESPRTP